MEHSEKFALLVQTLGIRGLMQMAPFDLDAFTEERGYNMADRKFLGLISNFDRLIKPVLALE